MNCRLYFATLSFALSLTSCVKYEAHSPRIVSPGPEVVIQKSSELNTHTQIFLIDSPVKGQLGKALHAGFESCERSPQIQWHELVGLKNLDTRKSKFLKNDISLNQINPNPFAVIESLNLFSEDILAKKIDGESKIGLIPFMLLNYAKFLEHDSNLKINHVVSIKKFVGTLNDVKAASADHRCDHQVVEKITYGAAISVALGYVFKAPEDKILFADTFGEIENFSPNKVSPQDKELRKFLVDKKVEINFSVAQIGGSVEKTKKFVSEMSCSIRDLEACEAAQSQLVDYFFTEELAAPTSETQTNGWVSVQITAH
jgi:hypothetical protein